MLNKQNLNIFLLGRRMVIKRDGMEVDNVKKMERKVNWNVEKCVIHFMNISETHQNVETLIFQKF
jgi:hypothetical protein